MAIIQPLYNHTSFETAYKVDDYPYGRLRCNIWFWIESNKRGSRFCSRTQNPKNSVMNKPKHEQYHLLCANMYLDENNHCTYMGLNEYSRASYFEEYLTHFTQMPNEHRKRILSFSLQKSALYSAVLKSGKEMFKINGVEKDLTEEAKQGYIVDIETWKHIVQLAKLS